MKLLEANINKMLLVIEIMIVLLFLYFSGTFHFLKVQEKLVGVTRNGTE